ncbi:glycosyltransferase family A protein [Paenibacillus sp. USHLN196]|uniref:glycosyltransferase family A protein n=1 Tax=Paenibacillus sp. USHLN196 TaxID=3081291 RepID=UPI003019E788
MELWYVEDKLSPKLPEIFNDWLKLKVTKVFLPEMQELKKWQETIKVIRYNSETVEGINLNDAFANALNLANRVISECELDTEKRNKICLLINNGNLAIGHFLIQNALCKNDHLSNVLIVLIQEKNLPIHVGVNYKFPDYWIYRRNESSVISGHGVITWNENIYELLDKHQKVLLLKEDSINFSYMTDWLETKLSLNKSLYPSDHKIQKQINYEPSVTEEDLLSVIVPFYNMGSLLLETIQSINNSTYRNIEIIIVNDGSDNEESIGALELIKNTMNDISIINIENQGLSNARNVGARVAKGRFISFLDADDLVDPLYYEKCIRVLDNYENVSFVYSWVQFFGMKNSIWVTFDAEFPLLLLTNMLSAFPVIRTSDFLEYGVNKPIMDKGMEDHESWISLLENGCIGVSIPEPLVFYRIRSDSMSRQFNREIVNELFIKISHLHSSLYKQYGQEIFNLTYVNGPGYLWNNPAIDYPNVTHGSPDSYSTDNKTKYELLRLMNSNKGRFMIKWFFKLKMNRLFK